MVRQLKKANLTVNCIEWLIFKNQHIESCLFVWSPAAFAACDPSVWGGVAGCIVRIYSCEGLQQLFRHTNICYLLQTKWWERLAEVKGVTDTDPKKRVLKITPCSWCQCTLKTLLTKCASSSTKHASTKQQQPGSEEEKRLFQALIYQITTLTSLRSQPPC